MKYLKGSSAKSFGILAASTSTIVTNTVPELTGRAQRHGILHVCYLIHAVIPVYQLC